MTKCTERSRGAREVRGKRSLLCQAGDQRLVMSRIRRVMTLYEFLNTAFQSIYAIRHFNHWRKE